jgi:hypothetical protein
MIRNTVTIAALLLLAGCAGSTQPQGGSAPGADRQGHFARSADDMAVCLTVTQQAKHADLRYNVDVTPPQRVWAATDTTLESRVWIAEFRDAGTGASDVILRNVKASPADLDDVWGTVENCSHQS